MVLYDVFKITLAPDCTLERLCSMLYASSEYTLSTLELHLRLPKFTMTTDLNFSHLTISEIGELHLDAQEVNGNLKSLVDIENEADMMKK